MTVTRSARPRRIPIPRSAKREGRARFVERSFDESGAQVAESVEVLTIARG